MQRVALAVAACLATFLVYLFAWPQQLGGQAHFIVVSGVSMEPTYHTGDLVVVRRATNYTVGDVAAFRTAEGDVIHRILGGNAEQGFVMQGDNKDRIDPWYPTAQQVIGKAWLHVPTAGRWLAAARDRIGPPTAFGVAGALLLTDLGRRRRRRRRRVPALAELRDYREERSMSTSGRYDAPPRAISVTLVATLVVAVVLAPLLWSSWRTPATAMPDPSRAHHTHATSFTYTAVAAEPSVVYPDGQVGPVEPLPASERPQLSSTAVGSPTEAPYANAEPDAEDELGVTPEQALYTRLVERLDLTVEYALESRRDVTDLRGTAQAALRIETPDGWNETLPVSASAPVTSEGAELDVTIAFDEVGQRIGQVAAASGVNINTFDVVVATTIDLAATVGGRDISEEVSAEFPVTVTPSLIEPATQLTVVEPRADTNSVEQRNSIVLLGLSTGVVTARLVTTVSLLAVLGAAAVASYLGWGRDRALRIRLLHWSVMVDVDSYDDEHTRRVPMRSIGELVRLAKRDQRMVLHHDLGDGEHRYVVTDGDVSFEYRLDAEDDADDLEVPQGSLAQEPVATY